MSLRMLSFNQIVEPERRRWIPCRCVLSKDDQEACDRMFACAKEPLHAEVQLGRPWRLEVMLMAVLSAHQRLRSSSKPLQCWEGMVASLETELPLELVDTELPIIAFPLQHTERD